jgi:hypothetical protein
MLSELRRRALLLALLTATTLAACGGGGDDDEEDEDEDDGISIPDDEDASGLWLGTVNRVGASDPFAVIASPNGEFIGVVISATGNTGRLLVGSGTVAGNKLNANGTIFAGAGATLPLGQQVALVTLPQVTVVERVSMAGSYSGGGEVGIFTLNFDAAKTNRGASLAALTGTYTTFPAPTTAGAANWSLAIAPNGTATFATNTGCNGTGTFAVIDAAYNVYSWTLNNGVCGTTPATTFSGLATLDDNPTGGTSNLLRMFGATALTRNLPFGFVGTK